MKAIVLLALLSSACAGSFRSIGMEDPSVEIVRSMSAAQSATIKSLMEALVQAQANACGASR